MHNDQLLWYVFVVGFVATASAETFLPLRSLPSSTARRWFSNSVLLAVSSVAVAALFQVSALAFAFRSAGHGALGRLPSWTQFVIGFTLLDLLFYFSHRLFHAFGILWRVHQVHHCESDLDLTTGFRFHPLEALLTQGMLFLGIFALGIPPAAVALNGIVTVCQNYLEHANLRFPESMERILRVLIITPAVHRVHHSEDMREQNRNFGTIFSLWDRIFGTFEIAAGGTARTGLAELANGSELHAMQLLALPFRRVTQSEQQPAPDVSALSSPRSR